MAYKRKRTVGFRAGKRPRRSRGKSRSFKRRWLAARRVSSRRLRPSQKRFINQLSLVGETKYRGRNSNPCIPPNGLPGPHSGNPGFNGVFVNTGVGLNPTLFPNFTALNAFEFPEGSGEPYNRNGDWLFIRKCRVRFVVQMHPIEISTNSPQSAQSALNHDMCFRLLVVKANRKLTKYGGADPNIRTELFRNTQNEPFGLEDDATHDLFLNGIVNKAKFSVWKDKKFKMSPPAVGVNDGTRIEAGVNGKYAATRTFTMNLPLNIKAKMDDGGDVPTNCDTQWLFMLIGTRQSYCWTDPNAMTANRNYTVNVRSTTSALDA